MIKLPITYSPDPVDEAEALGRLLIDVQLNKSRLIAANINTENPGGTCLWCEEETGHKRRWCDNYCRDDWQKFENREE
jgi:hypothetical protein